MVKLVDTADSKSAGLALASSSLATSKEKQDAIPYNIRSCIFIKARFVSYMVS